MHCALSVPAKALVVESWMRVGTTNITWEEGSCFAFDESCEHEVVFHSRTEAAEGGDRVVLIIDFANPFLEEQSYVEAHQEPMRSEALAAHRMFVDRSDDKARLPRVTEDL
jgi:hypothetical protein